jgi:hypothetical protein
MIRIIDDCKNCVNKEICKFKTEREMAVDFLKTAQWREGRFIDNAQGLEITVTCNYLHQPKYRQFEDVKHGHWEYWDGWSGNHDKRIEDATCSICGYKHHTVRLHPGEKDYVPDKLAKECPGCKAIMDGDKK